MASEAAWLKMVPMAMADGFTGGRSGEKIFHTEVSHDFILWMMLEHAVCFGSLQHDAVMQGRHIQFAVRFFASSIEI